MCTEKKNQGQSTVYQRDYPCLHLSFFIHLPTFTLASALFLWYLCISAQSAVVTSPNVHSVQTPSPLKHLHICLVYRACNSSRRFFLQGSAKINISAFTRCSIQLHLVHSTRFF